MILAGKRRLGEQIKLVRAEHPRFTTLGARPVAPALDVRKEMAGSVDAEPLSGIQMGELGNSDRNDRRRDYRITQIPKIAERFLEHGAVVHPRHDYHLAVKANAARGEPFQLCHDVGDARIVEKNLS